MLPDTLITDIAQQLQTVPGLLGIVLGGSRARGTHTPTSEIDFGLYYILESVADECAALVDDKQG